MPADETKRHSDLLLVARVPAHSPVVNNTVREAGLKGMERLFLVAVERQVLASQRNSRSRIESVNLLFFQVVKIVTLQSRAMKYWSSVNLTLQTKTKRKSQSFEITPFKLT